MSAVTVVEEAARPLTLTLRNGEIINFKSNTSIEADEIPIIDVSRIYSDEFQDRKAVAEEVREACRRIGFFYAINHGIDPPTAKGAFEGAKRFFAQPMDEKMKVCTDLVPDEFYGYHPLSAYNRNNNKYTDLSEAFNWGYDAQYDPEAVDPNQPSASIWPANLPGFRDDMYAHHTLLLHLARKLTRTFALALDMPEDYFDDYIRRPEASARIVHYPVQQKSANEQLGIGAHTDFECFTLVTQDDCGGLEVLSKSGYWVKAKPVPGSIVVNVADCFMRQTNDFFVSTVHRVVNHSGAERYSYPFFFGFDRTKELSPVPSCVSKENPMKYPIMTGGEYYKLSTALSKATAVKDKA